MFNTSINLRISNPLTVMSDKKLIFKIFSILGISFFIQSITIHAQTIDASIIPDDLLLGAASAAYQVEGAWNEDGKGENIWDHMSHTRPHKIADESNGDIACDSYHKTKEDVALMKDVGLQFYRFSLSWSRILPSGFPNEVNPAGIAYYNGLIDELLANNITPIVTIFHWDLPQPLQDLGGFANPAIVEWFSWYCHIVFENFGDRVKTWITINEPKQICQFGYGTGRMAPGIQLSGIADYICGHNLLKAHARVYHLYDTIFRPIQKGHIGITIECQWSEPANNLTDLEAAHRRRQFEFGIYANPIFHKNGGYPEVVKKYVGKRSKAEGFQRSRLPEFSPEEIEYIKGTSDFFGINHYITRYVTDKEPDPIGDPGNEKDEQAAHFQDSTWIAGSNPYFKLVPWGLRSILNYIKSSYDDPDIYITENGFPDWGELDDQVRVRYHKEYLQAMLEAVYYDGVKVKIYTAWSLLDNFEWSSGYTVRFGLYHVNFTDPKRTRTPKASAYFYKDVIRERRIPT